MENKCLFCKGRYPQKYCHTDVCPLYKKVYNFKKSKINSENFATQSRTPFVGRFNYPDVNLGILAPTEIKKNYDYDTTIKWGEKNYSINDVIDVRSKLLNSNFKTNVKAKNLGKVQELSIGKKPVDLDVELYFKPKFSIKFKPESAPYGANAKLKDFTIMSNAKIPKVVDKAITDDDLKANAALNFLHKKEIDEDYLIRIFSVGMLGSKVQRKLVPTRWSITAVDDSLFMGNFNEIKYFKSSDCLAYLGGYLGNNYLIFFFPGAFRYELFEMKQGNGKVFTTNYEDVFGRKKYAEETAGGYYASRLIVSEKLKELKVQASVLAIRIISEDYVLPLGVWVVREATRKTLNTKPIKFSSKDLMLTFAKIKANKSFNTDLSKVLETSKLVNTLMVQKGLTDYA